MNRDEMMDNGFGRISDPMERIIAGALAEAGVSFQHETQGAPLDFYLTREKIHIEVKRLHSDRISDQMRRVDDVVVAQGKPAIEWLAGLLRDNAAMRRELAATTAETLRARAKETPDAE